MNPSPNYLLPILFCSALFSEFNFVNFEGSIPIRLSLGDIAIIFFVCFYLYLLKDNIIKIVKRNRLWVSLGLLFITVGVLAGVVNNDLWLVSVKSGIKIYLLFFLLSLLYQDIPVSRGTLIALCLIMIFINAIAILEFIVPDKINGFLLFIFKSKEYLVHSRYNRVSSVFLNPNPFGTFNAVFAIAWLSIELNYKKLVNHYLGGTTLFLCLTGVILSGSREALLTVLVGMALLMYISMRDKTKTLRWVLLVFTIFGVMLFIGIKYNATIANRISQVLPVASKVYEHKPVCLRDFVPRYDLYVRSEIWEKGISMFRDKPIFGLGINQFQYQNGLVFVGNSPNRFHMHDFFGEVLVDTGLVGISLIFLLVISWFRHAKAPWQVGVIIVLLVSHAFDCFITLDILWVIFIPWLVSITTREPGKMLVDS